MSVKINIKDTDMYTALQAAYLGTLIVAVSISAEHMDRIAGNRQFGINTLRIQPSAMYFTRPEGGRAAQLVETSEPSGVVRVCYSTHSSYEGIIDFMRTIRPENISANVCPKDCKNVEEATERIQFLRAGGHPDTNMPDKEGQSQIRTSTIGRFNKFKKRRVTLPSSY